MTVIPAQEAGVREIVVASPQPGPALLAAAEKLGVRRVARVGGAQAIAALAYGTRSIPRVDKIFGPGNRFVTAAKKLVSNDCAIDMLAGPTEALVFAQRGNARFIARRSDRAGGARSRCDFDFRDHFGASGARRRRRNRKPAGATCRKRIWRGARSRKMAQCWLRKNLAAAARFVNRFAPEHLSLPGGADGLLDRIDSAGSIFLGDWSAQSFGDYASGTNHVLPTGGVARTRGGLSVADFVKCISVQEVSRAGVRRLAPVVEEFARAEGLQAHARSVEVRK